VRFDFSHPVRLTPEELVSERYGGQVKVYRIGEVSLELC
jgi:alanyl-tRNA synthetase